MADHLVTTPARLKTCPRCHAQVLTGHAEGLQATVDATPLPDRAAEIRALLDGHATYTRLRNSELIHRDATRISDPTLRGDVHAEHKCAGPAQGELF